MVPGNLTTWLVTVLNSEVFTPNELQISLTKLEILGLHKNQLSLEAWVFASEYQVTKFAQISHIEFQFL